MVSDYSAVVLEPAAQQLVEATAKPPFLVDGTVHDFLARRCGRTLS